MGSIELDLGDIRQLFNSMDPSPFRERDLDADAEEFLVGWAQEFPLPEELSLVLHLKETLPPVEVAAVEAAVRHYFSYRAGLTRLELGRLLSRGRLSLAVGVVFLALCTLAGGLIARWGGPAASVTREGLVIAGWVAMWRPMEIYLYDWWPLLRKRRIFEKMSRMRVEVRHKRP